MLEGTQATGAQAFSATASDLSLVDPQLLLAAPDTISRTHTPLTAVANRTRGLDLSDDEPEPSRKRQRRKGDDRVDLGQAIAGMAKELRLSRESNRELAGTPQERAMELLNKEYDDRLDDEAFLEAVDLFESDAKARAFITLKPGHRRDRWLEIAISKELLPQR